MRLRVRRCEDSAIFVCLLVFVNEDNRHSRLVWNANPVPVNVPRSKAYSLTDCVWSHTSDTLYIGDGRDQCVANISKVD